MCNIFFNLCFFIYFLSVVFYFFSLIFKRQPVKDYAQKCITLGFFIHTLLICIRFYETRQPPFVTLYESLLFYSWSIMFVYLIFRRRYPVAFIGGMVSTLLLTFFGVLSLLDKTSQPLVPVLKSNWLFIHVSSYFIGYGAATISFIFALIYLVQYKREKEKFLDFVDALSFRFIGFSFIFLTIGLTTGSVWANVAWGSWWSWDPKETWSLITWLVYAVYLHVRIFQGRKGKVCAYLNILGFICILFTFFGVNYLLQGLHSYM